MTYTKTVRSLCIHSVEKLTELLSDLHDVEWDLLLLSETRAPSETYILDGGHVLYTALDDNKFGGVAILLHAKHVRKSNKIHEVSGRILALDFMVNKIKVRAVAVYLPHMGYAVSEFHDTFDQLRCVIDQGQKCRQRLVIGGDFNTQLGVGMRGAALAELQHSLSLNVLNDVNTPWEEQWTFRSSLGDTRKIDFLLASTSIEYVGVHATSEIDLGSDHRAVKGELFFGLGSVCNRRKNPKCRWRLPDVGQGTALRTYHGQLDVELEKMGSLTCASASKLVLDAAFTDGAYMPEKCQPKPWESEVIKRLRQDRKNSPCQIERTRLSKQIRKQVRQALRKWQSEQAEQVLLEFTDL